MQVIATRRTMHYQWVIACYAVNTFEDPDGAGPLAADWYGTLQVQRIKIPLCQVDMNLDGVADAQDMALFQSAYDAQDPAADFNEDGSVDTQDQIIFNSAYPAGCDQ